MRKIILTLLLTAGTILFSMNSFAQDTSKPRTKFYNFDDMLIDGAIKKPKGALFDVRSSAKFKKFKGLDKRSFLPELEATADEPKLK